MTYESFKQELIQMLSVHLSADTSFQVQQILKNNGLRLDGLSISTPEVNISPTIYLNYYYEQYQSGTSLDSIADKILATTVIVWRKASICLFLRILKRYVSVSSTNWSISNRTKPCLPRFLLCPIWILLSSSAIISTIPQPMPRTKRLPTLPF